jgi:transcription elongation factor Elf1
VGGKEVMTRKATNKRKSEATITASCPTCSSLQPHRTLGVETEPDGRKFQTMTCTTCGTSTKVYSGERGQAFQENYDFSDDTDTSETKLH